MIKLLRSFRISSETLNSLEQISKNENLKLTQALDKCVKHYVNHQRSSDNFENRIEKLEQFVVKIKDKL